MRPPLAALLAVTALAAPAAAQPMSHSMPGMTMPMPMPAAHAAKGAHKPAHHAGRKKPRRRGHHATGAAHTHGGSHPAEMHGMPVPGAPVAGQAQSGHDMSAMPGMTPSPAAPSEHAMPGMPGMPGMSETTAAEPEPGHEPAPPPPTDHAADRAFDPAVMRAARARLGREHSGGTASMVMVTLAEHQARREGGGYRWEAEAWTGGAINRFTLKTEGEGGWRDGLDAAEVQALYSRAVGPYFNLQAGVRQDFRPTPSRTYLTVGLEGLAPYWFEVSGAAFVSTKGDVLARLEGYQDFRITQRLILQPRAEMNLAAQDVPELSLGAGITNLELGLRLRYEFRREFAPYIGISYDGRFGRTADFARARGRGASDTSFVAGVRAWF